MLNPVSAKALTLSCFSKLLKWILGGLKQQVQTLGRANPPPQMFELQANGNVLQSLDSRNRTVTRTKKQLAQELPMISDLANTSKTHPTSYFSSCSF